MPEEVTLQELLAQKDQRIRELEADKQQLAQEIKLLKEKLDLLIRRIFGSKSEKLDSAQLELLLKDLDSGKADASVEKAEAAPIVEVLKAVAKRPEDHQRRERWLFFGDADAGERSAIIYSIIESCTRHGVEPYT